MAKRLTDKVIQEHADNLRRDYPNLRLIDNTIYGCRFEQLVGDRWQRCSNEGLTRKEAVAWIDGWYKAMSWATGVDKTA